MPTAVAHPPVPPPCEFSSPVVAMARRAHHGRYTLFHPQPVSCHCYAPATRRATAVEDADRRRKFNILKFTFSILGGSNFNILSIQFQHICWQMLDTCLMKRLNMLKRNDEYMCNLIRLEVNFNRWFIYFWMPGIDVSCIFVHSIKKCSQNWDTQSTKPKPTTNQCKSVV